MRTFKCCHCGVKTTSQCVSRLDALRDIESRGWVSVKRSEVVCLACCATKRDYKDVTP